MSFTFSSGLVRLTIPSYREMNWHEILSGTFSTIYDYLNEVHEARGSSDKLGERLNELVPDTAFAPYRNSLNRLVTDIDYSNEEVIRKYIYHAMLPQNCILSLQNFNVSGNTLTISGLFYNSSFAGASGVYYIPTASVTVPNNSSGVIYLSGTTLNFSSGLVSTLDDANVNGVPIGFYSGSFKLAAKNRYWEIKSGSLGISGNGVYQFNLYDSNYRFFYRIKRTQVTLYDLSADTEYDLSNIFTVKKVGMGFTDPYLVLMVNTNYGVSGTAPGLFVSGGTMITSLTGDLTVRVYG